MFRHKRSHQGAPNFLLILLDDVGFGQFSTFGGGVPSPTMDRLAAFDAQGRVWGTRKLSVKLGLNAANRGSIGDEIFPRLTVPPGRYEIRIAVRTEDGRSGSVYTFVDVPDFSQNGVSLSGIVLEATPAVAAAPPDAYTDLLPVVPTARRAFGASDRVAAFVRVYQGGSHALVPSTLTTRIVDANNEQITKSTVELDPTLFVKGRAFVVDSICRTISRRASTSSPWKSPPTARLQSGRSASAYDELVVKAA